MNRDHPAAASAASGAAALSIDASAFAHRAIMASAGSGKTHALTTRYLQLVAAGADPATVFASTFTRLAAAEIRDRVLKRLSEAATDERKRRELAAALCLQHPGALTEEAATAMLARLVRGLHVLQLRTLDSFFASVVRMFAIELGLPVGADVIDEEQETALRREAIALMLDERRPQELVDLLRQLTRGEAGRSVTDAIDDVVCTMYDLWREAPAEAWDCVPELPGKLNLANVVAAIERLEAVSPGSDKRFIKAHADDLRRARAFDWEAFITSGLAKCIAIGKTKYYGKEITADVVAAYQPLIAHARSEVVDRLREQTLATREMLRLFHEQFESLKRDRGVVTFGDLVTWTERAMERCSLEAIAFRLDAAVQHVLLDEFQDTSIAQWRALQPIVEEITATAPPERSLFCVGDVKQSIYGWRGAAPEVLTELPGAVANLDVRTLTKSFRSSPIVIDVVNRVFEGLRENPALDERADATDAWQGGFEHHSSAHPDHEGYVEVRMVERVDEDGEKPGERQWAHRLREAAKHIAAMASARPDALIAVLVRTNGSVARLLYELGPSRLNVRASGRGGGPVTDAPACNALLDVLRLVDHPNDTVAAFGVATSPVGERVGLKDWNNKAARRRVASDVRKDIMQHGLAMTLAKLAQKIAADCDARELQRVYQLVELAEQFDAQPSLRMDDFVAMAERKLVPATQPAMVQVMTIHQAKGLDFDAVVLPDLDFCLTGAQTPKVVYERDGETGPITRICRYIQKDIEPLVPELTPLKERMIDRTVRESLSLLYVAMTRPKHALHIFLDEPKANERTVSCTASNVVRFGLPLGDDRPVAWSHGDVNWKKPPERREAQQAGEQRQLVPTPIRFAPSARRAFERAPSPAALVERGEMSFAGAWTHHLDPEARDRGTAMHCMAQQIEWLGKSCADDAALFACVKARLPRRGDDWIGSLVREFCGALRTPDVQSLFTKPAPGEFVVRREIPFARETGEGAQTGAIDRLVIEMAGGKPARAEVIDFKSNIIDPASADEHALRYKPQLEAYQKAAAEMLGIEPGRVSMKVVFLHAGRVVAL